MNCGSCVYREKGCAYLPLKKYIENEIWERDIAHILKLTCSEYESKIYSISKTESMSQLGITQGEIDACGEVDFE